MCNVDLSQQCKTFLAAAFNCSKTHSENTRHSGKYHITVQLTSCLTGLDLTKQVKLLFIQYMENSWIHTQEVIYTVILSLKLLFKASFNPCVDAFGTSVARFWRKKVAQIFQKMPRK